MTIIGDCATQSTIFVLDECIMTENVQIVLDVMEFVSEKAKIYQLSIFDKLILIGIAGYMGQYLPLPTIELIAKDNRKAISYTRRKLNRLQKLGLVEITANQSFALNLSAFK